MGVRGRSWRRLAAAAAAAVAVTAGIGVVPQAAGAREARARAAELGAVEAVSKPFDLSQVVAAVGRWIKRGPSAAE